MSWSNTGERGWAYRGETPMSSVNDLTLEALIRERDEARAEVERLREAAERSMSLCSWECSDEIYCGRCAPLVRALRFGE